MWLGVEVQHPVFKSVLLSGDEWLRLPVYLEGMHVPCPWSGSGLSGAPTGAAPSQHGWSGLIASTVVLPRHFSLLFPVPRMRSRGHTFPFLLEWV